MTEDTDSASSSPPLDLDLVRSYFPGLESDWVFLDNAGGSQILQPVLDRINEYLRTSNVQHGASYAVSRQAEDRLAEAARGVATLVNAASADEIIMGPSSSIMIRMLAESVGRRLAAGDEIVVSRGDHEANIGPWLDLARLGVAAKYWNPRPTTLELHLEDLEPLLTPRTRLVAVTHVSNIFGRINPIREIADRVHEAGALLCVDGVAYAPHRAVDVQALDADFYATSFYKVYGPHHAVMYGKRDLLLQLPSLNHFFVEESEIPYKFQPGNVNYELSYGMLGLIDYIRSLAVALGAGAVEGAAGTLRVSEGESTQRARLPDNRTAVLVAFDAMAAHEELLAERFIDYLDSKPKVRIVGPTTSARRVRVPTISFCVVDADSRAIVEAVDAHRIGIRYGDFYSHRLVDDLGLRPSNGVVRVSMVHYNTLGEIDRLIRALDQLI